MVFAPPLLNYQNLVNGNSPLSRNLAGWWLCLPGLASGPLFHDLTGKTPLTLTTMNNTSNGWRGSARPGGNSHLLFDGSAGYAKAANTFGVALGPLTLSMWIYVNSVSMHGLFCKLGGTNNGYGMAIGLVDGGSDGNNLMARLDGIGWAVCSPGVGTGWVYCTTTFLQGSSTTVQFYVNGKKLTSVNVSAVSASGSFSIGADTDGSNPFAGRMDDVRVWNRVLSDGEVWLAYQDSLLGYPTTLNRVVFSPFEAAPPDGRKILAPVRNDYRILQA